jgi:multiple sugar transport system substrate-binding protein
VAAAVGIASGGSPFAGGSQTVTFWHLFSGGDGIRMTQMLSALAKKDRKVDVRPLILPWGNPYYTKLSLAAAGGSPPDVAILHATKLGEFAPAGLLEPLPPDLLERHGLTPDRFLAKPWQSSRYQGKQYAIPLDTHPFVLYLNTAMAKKAGVLNKPLDGPEALLDAFDAVKKATGKGGVIFETRGVTPWRLFLTLYSELGGKPLLTDLGKRVDVDHAKALKALE